MKLFSLKKSATRGAAAGLKDAARPDDAVQPNQVAQPIDTAQPTDITQRGLRVDLHNRQAGHELRVQAQFSQRGITAVYGPSGSGKSTLLNMIAGFAKPNQASEISFNQQQWLQKNGAVVAVHRRRIAYVTQSSALLPHLRVQDNLAYGLVRSKKTGAGYATGFITSNVTDNVTGNSANTAADSLAAIASELDIEHLQHKYPAQLSGGEQQRVAIGRALLSNPQLMLFDEPLSALDEANRESTLAVLEKLHQRIQVPCIYVTHNFDEMMRLADEVLLIANGQGRAPLNVAQALCDPELELSRQSGCGVVLEGRVTSIDTQIGLLDAAINTDVTLQCSLGALPPQVNQRVRLRVYAKDVSIALSKAADSSILNILPATVQGIADYRVSQALVTLRCGEQNLLSVITKKSLVELALREGQTVYAQIKGVAVLGARL